LVSERSGWCLHAAFDAADGVAHGALGEGRTDARILLPRDKAKQKQSKTKQIQNRTQSKNKIKPNRTAGSRQREGGTYDFVKRLLHDAHGVADLADALCIVVAGVGGGLEDAGANEEIVADFDGEEEACA
jgi:hypothetical protein